MTNLNNLVETLKNNQNLKEIDKEIIVDFVGDLLELGYPTIDLDNFTQSMKDFRIDTYADIYESKISEYDKEQNKMLVHQLMFEKPENITSEELKNKKDSIDRNYRYHIYKSLLKCASTKKENGIISTGVVDSENKNNALNAAITERFIELMLGCEYNLLDLEMDNFSKIQEIIGIDTIIEAYFKADYKALEQEFNAYDIDLNDLSTKMDRIMDLNLGNSVANNDETLVSDVDRILMTGYAKKISREDINNLNIENYRGHIITKESAHTYSKQHLNIFENTDRNIEYFNMLLNGVMASKQEVKEY
ncbi:MAG: hypothetical protein IJO32_01030 [Bacilli bacterium]|nr:hypothetical protein [Bacilli bacterium]